MKVPISWFTRAGFGLGRIKADELIFLNETFSAGLSIKDAVQNIKTNVSAGYYRNLEHRASQTRKNTDSELEKENLTKILIQLRAYNWHSSSAAKLMPKDPHKSLHNNEPQEKASPSSTTLTPTEFARLFSNNELKMEPDHLTRSKAKEKKECIRTLTKVEAANLKQAILDEKTYWNELNIAEYNLNDTFPRFYKNDLMGNIKHIGRRPQPSLKTFENNLEIAGSSKKMECKDENYLKLRLKQEELIYTCNEFNNLAVNKLRDYPSICQSIFIQNELIISLNGGVSLEKIIDDVKNPKKLDIHQFKQLAIDIYNMQESYIYMTDIKLENLVCQADGKGPVFLVDIDSVCHEGNCHALTYNKHHITDELYQDNIIRKKITDNKENKHLALRNISTYALLITIIEANTGIHWNVSYHENGHLSSIISEWIKLRVKEEHQNTLLDFIENPHLQEVPLNLAEMLNFTNKQLAFK